MMYRTYNFRPVSPPSPCVVLPGAIAKGLSPIKPRDRTLLETSRKGGQSSGERSNNSFKEYAFVLPSGARRRRRRKRRERSHSPLSHLRAILCPNIPPPLPPPPPPPLPRDKSPPPRRHRHHTSPLHHHTSPLHHSSRCYTFKVPKSDAVTFPKSRSCQLVTVTAYGFDSPSVESALMGKTTTEHYTQWYDSKSCSSRIGSGKEGNCGGGGGGIEVPSLYTAVTPKSFLPPSPLRTKQFVMPLKLHQLEPQKKNSGGSGPPSDITVTFVQHRKAPSQPNEQNRTSNMCSKTGNKLSRSKAKGNAASSAPEALYPDPFENAPPAFINRLSEMTSHQSDTVRFERTRRTKTRTRLNNS